MPKTFERWFFHLAMVMVLATAGLLVQRELDNREGTTATLGAETENAENAEPGNLVAVAGTSATRSGAVAAAASDEEFAVVSPDTGATVNEWTPMVSGTGNPGDVVTLDADSAEITAEGTWSLRVFLWPGDNDLVFVNANTGQQVSMALIYEPEITVATTAPPATTGRTGNLAPKRQPQPTTTQRQTITREPAATAQPKQRPGKGAQQQGGQGGQGGQATPPAPNPQPPATQPPTTQPPTTQPDLGRKAREAENGGAGRKAREAQEGGPGRKAREAESGGAGRKAREAAEAAAQKVNQPTKPGRKAREAAKT